MKYLFWLGVYSCKCHTTHEYLVLWQCPNQTRELFSQKGHRKIETFVDYLKKQTEKLKERKMRNGDDEKGLLWKLPVLKSNNLGKVGPGFGIGAGCGLGFGIGLLGGTLQF